MLDIENLFNLRRHALPPEPVRLSIPIHACDVHGPEASLATAGFGSSSPPLVAVWCVRWPLHPAFGSLPRLPQFAHQEQE
jgi:hypothetical protein